ncbi:hypothetical protein GCM10009001_23640 [Virgibacillus siamensis]|uniref:Spore coat protein GerQ n=1 Tax=Virgibacillus siamensis TaxID=480071 RepID=A0ABN1G7H4_9BACI
MSNFDPYGNNPYQAYYPYYYYPQAAPAYYPAYDPRQENQNQNQNQMQMQMQMPQGTAPPSQEQGEPTLPTEQSSYIENILRLNEGKIATVYMSFENDAEWSSKVFRGRIEAAGLDHIILSDLETERRYLLLMIYLDYITFEGEINYSYPYGNSSMATYPSR